MNVQEKHNVDLCQKENAEDFLRFQAVWPSISKIWFIRQLSANSTMVATESSQKTLVLTQKHGKPAARTF